MDGSALGFVYIAWRWHGMMGLEIRNWGRFIIMATLFAPSGESSRAPLIEITKRFKKLPVLLKPFWRNDGSMFEDEAV